MYKYNKNNGACIIRNIYILTIREIERMCALSVK